MGRTLLILDVDETLIHGSDAPLPAIQADFLVGPFHVHRRPFLSEFLAGVAEHFDLAVWSSASGGYVRGIVERVFGEPHGLRFVWSAERCTRRFDPELQEYFNAKNLSKVEKLGYAIERVLIVDDSPEKVSRHYGNHVPIRPFTGEAGDAELRDLLPYLRHLSTAENVRKVEKRYWRNAAAGLR